MPFEAYEQRNALRLTYLFSCEKLGSWNKFEDSPLQERVTTLEELRKIWLQAKRPFSKPEISDGTWKKTDGRNHSFIVQCLPNERLIEYAEEEKEKTWYGSWKLIDGILRLKVGKYELDVVANKKGNQHSGIEVKDSNYSAYFTVIHVV